MVPSAASGPGAVELGEVRVMGHRHPRVAARGPWRRRCSRAGPGTTLGSSRHWDQAVELGSGSHRVTSEPRQGLSLGDRGDSFTQRSH